MKIHVSAGVFIFSTILATECSAQASAEVTLTNPQLAITKITNNKSGVPFATTELSKSDYGAAYAFSDLSTGTLRGSSQSVVTGYGFNSVAFGTSTSSFSDTIIFATATTATSRFSYRFEGSIVPQLLSDDFYYSYARFTLQLRNLDSGILYSANRYIAQDCSFFSPASACKNTDTHTFQSFSESLDIPITPGARYSINAELYTQGVNGDAADFSHTAQLSLSTPTGVSYVSNSGLLFTAAVPEPRVHHLMLPGLLTLLIWRRRAKLISS